MELMNSFSQVSICFINNTAYQHCNSHVIIGNFHYHKPIIGSSEKEQPALEIYQEHQNTAYSPYITTAGEN